jgi:hypothetical protein
MRTDNLVSLGNKTDILTDYFDKNHRYRTGLLSPAPRALVYNDDDWADSAAEDSLQLAMSYAPSDITTVSAPEATTAADYIDNRLTAPYEFIFIRSHGYPGGHGFYRDAKSTFEYVYSDDYRLTDPEAVFYSLFVCSGADYTADDNLAGTIAFNRDNSGLLSIGSTKTGGMLSASSFYTALGNGSIFGDAFRQWFNNVQSDRPGDTPHWWYGMVLIGDGALKIGPDNTGEDNQIDVNTTGLIIDKAKDHRDVAAFTMTGVTDIETVAKEAAAAGLPLTFNFPGYSFTGTGFDAAGNRLIYSDDGNLVRCIFSKEICTVKIRYVDFDGAALDNLLPGDMTVSLEIGDTEYTNTGAWTRQDTRNSTKYRKN